MPPHICQTFQGATLKPFVQCPAGEAIATLLAGADVCAQQKMADKIIDAAKVS